MYFLISKILTFFLKPIVWIFLCLIRGLFSKDKKVLKKYALYSLLILFFFTQPFIFSKFFSTWEYPPTSMYSLPQYDYAILLGGVQEFATKDVDDRLLAPDCSGRLTTTVELFHLGKIKKIIITGGDAALFKGFSEPEAPFLKKVMMRMGVPDSVILVENASRNTYENAIFTKNIVEKENKNTSFLLITSGFHMKRSLKTFQKAGFVCTPFSTDILTEELDAQPKSYFSPDAKFLDYWGKILKEWVGYLTYWAKGYL
jgi:uncharacterized SAM-binding protein YcdF (DUF218 family)